MRKSNFAIVITAYNRANALQNLFLSLSKIETDLDIPLVISVDNKGTPEVVQLVERFEWSHGEKKIIVHPEKLGLRSHFIWAGDQTFEYENVLFLEDDLYVSPFVVDFVQQVIEKYKNDDRVTAGSLYNPLICEFDKCKFFQIEDGYDNYFFAHPYWGNIWMKDKWIQFKKWMETYREKPEILPRNVQLWNDTSFKKLYVQYLAETDRFVVYPRISYVTNMGEIGLHNASHFRQFQTSFQRGKRALCFSTFDESKSIYDVFFEYYTPLAKELNIQLKGYDFTMDLRGNRTAYHTEYVLTRRPVKTAILTFSNEFRPLECNVIENVVPGDDIRLARSEDVIREKKYARIGFADDVFNANYKAGIKEALSCLGLVVRQRFGN